MPSKERLLDLRAECWADDIECTDEMLIWSEAECIAFFEAGGVIAPSPPPPPPPPLVAPPAEAPPPAVVVPPQHAVAVSKLSQILAVSDLHLEHKANREWLEQVCHAVDPGSVLLCGGDVESNPDKLREHLRAMRRGHEVCFFVPGNHDVWLSCKSARDSLAKYRSLLRLCDEEGVKVAPTRLSAPESPGAAAVWVVPIHSWYHRSWDREPPLAAPAGLQLTVDPISRHAASDDAMCKWPDGLVNGSEALAAAVDALNDDHDASGAAWSFGRACEAIADERARAAASGLPPPVVISMSHFLPRQELLPEKRHLFMPSLHTIVGSDWLRRRVEQLQPDMHYYGHTHFAWDMVLEKVRYISWPLGSPGEQARRMPYAKDKEGCRRWRPLRVWDASGGLAADADCCYFSDLYKLKGRHPTSTAMASYTAAIFCPKAPIDEMISIERDGSTTSRADLEASMESLHAQVARWGRHMDAGPRRT